MHTVYLALLVLTPTTSPILANDTQTPRQSTLATLRSLRWTKADLTKDDFAKTAAKTADTFVGQSKSLSQRLRIAQRVQPANRRTGVWKSGKEYRVDYLMDGRAFDGPKVIVSLYLHQGRRLRIMEIVEEPTSMLRIPPIQGVKQKKPGN